MSETEKITVNLSVVDLGKIDLLVDQGFYSNRSDFIKSAIRNLLLTYSGDIENVSARKSVVAGILLYDKTDLEKILEKNEQLDIRIMGMLVLAKNVTKELAQAAIKSIKVFGVFKASDEVKEALKDRIL